MEFIKVRYRDLKWLKDCSDLQMGDGDTAREMIERWIAGVPADDIIAAQQARIGLSYEDNQE